MFPRSLTKVGSGSKVGLEGNCRVRSGTPVEPKVDGGPGVLVAKGAGCGWGSRRSGGGLLSLDLVRPWCL